MLRITQLIFAIRSESLPKLSDTLEGMAPKNNERFANVVRETMSVLGLTQADVAARGGPSDTTLRKILDNEPVGISVATLRKLDAAFRWQPGSAAAALAGGRTPFIEAEREFPDPTPQFAPLIAAIAVDADDLLHTARNLPLGVDTHIDASDVDEVETLVSDVESLVWEVESLVTDIDDFVDRIGEYAQKMMDPSLLQRLKRDTQRFRRRQYLEQHGVELAGMPPLSQADDPMAAYRASPTRSEPTRDSRETTSSSDAPSQPGAPAQDDEVREGRVPTSMARKKPRIINTPNSSTQVGYGLAARRLEGFDKPK